jgi:hypothetical protein
MPKRIFLGGLIGGLFTAVDGAIVGLIVKFFFAADDTWWLVGMWAFYFAVVGAVLGGILGMFWKTLVQQLTLRPPLDMPTSDEPGV